MAYFANSSGTNAGARLAASVFGLLLLLSAFLPWMSPTAKMGSDFSSASGMDVSALIGLTAILGGLLVIGLAWMPLRGIKGGMHILLGLATLGVLALLLFNKTLPLLSSVVRTYVSIGFGVYLFAFSSLAIAIIGMTELPKGRARIRTLQAQQTYSAETYGKPIQPYPNTSAFCRNCGTQLNFGAAFCAGCGAPMAMAMPAAPMYAQPVYPQMPMRPVQKVSGAWWLLPIFLGALGGLIAFFGVLKRKPGMAVAMLILGVVLNVIAYLVIRNIANSLSDFGVSFS